MARFVKLDLDQWEPPEHAANPAKVAKVEPSRGNSGPGLAGLATLAGLPDDLLVGISRLKSMRPPRLVSPETWPIVVADAVRLVDEGWAAKALALKCGWAVLQLFGAVTDVAGDPYSDGLAVWLAGRRLLAIDATLAVVEDSGGRAYYNRREQVGARLLWELAR